MYHEMLENIRRNDERRSGVTLTIDLETGQRLSFLRKELHSPKAWIIRRLVEGEYAKHMHSSSKKKSSEMEVVAR